MQASVQLLLGGVFEVLRSVQASAQLLLGGKLTGRNLEPSPSFLIVPERTYWWRPLLPGEDSLVDAAIGRRGHTGGGRYWPEMTHWWRPLLDGEDSLVEAATGRRGRTGGGRYRPERTHWWRSLLAGEDSLDSLVPHPIGRQTSPSEHRSPSRRLIVPCRNEGRYTEPRVRGVTSPAFAMSLKHKADEPPQKFAICRQQNVIAMRPLCASNVGVCGEWPVSIITRRWRPVFVSQDGRGAAPQT